MYVLCAACLRPDAHSQRLTTGNQCHSHRRYSSSHYDAVVGNESRVDVTPRVTHGQAHRFRRCIILHALHLVHGDENPLVGAGETRKGRMTATSDSILGTSDCEKADSKLNFGDSGRLKDAIRRLESGW